MVGSDKYPVGNPRWLLAELTYACPLQCPYCSNPIDYGRLLLFDALNLEWRQMILRKNPKCPTCGTPE